MPALPDDSIAELFKDPNGVLMTDPGSFGISDHDFGFAHLEKLRLVGFRRQPFLNRLANVLQGFLARASLRMATFERRTAYGNSVGMFNQCDAIVAHN